MSDLEILIYISRSVDSEYLKSGKTERSFRDTVETLFVLLGFLENVFQCERVGIEGEVFPG